MKKSFILPVLLVLMAAGISCSGITDAASVKYVEPAISPDKDCGYYTYSYREIIPTYSEMTISLFALEGSSVNEVEQNVADVANTQMVKDAIFMNIAGKSSETSIDQINFVDMLDTATKKQLIVSQADFTTGLDAIYAKIISTLQNEAISSISIKVVGPYKEVPPITFNGSPQSIADLKTALSDAGVGSAYQYFAGNVAKKYILHAAAFSAQYYICAIDNEIKGPGIRSELEKTLYQETFTNNSGIEITRTELKWTSFNNTLPTASDTCLLVYINETPDETVSLSPNYEFDVGQYGGSTANRVQTGWETIYNPDGSSFQIPVYGYGDIRGLREVANISSNGGTAPRNYSFPYISMAQYSSYGGVSVNWNDTARLIGNTLISTADNIEKGFSLFCPKVILSTTNDFSEYTGDFLGSTLNVQGTYMGSDYNFDVNYRMLKGKVGIQFNYNRITSKNFIVLKMSDASLGSIQSALDELNLQHRGVQDAYMYRNTPFYSNVCFKKYNQDSTYFDTISTQWIVEDNKFKCILAPL